MTPIENLLPRLSRVRQTPTGWQASCPGPHHKRGDRQPSLAIKEADDRRVLLHCFAGCRADEITRAIGLGLSALFTQEDARLRPRAPQQKRPLPRRFATALLSIPELPATVEVAQRLAPLPPALMRQDVLDNWDYLSNVCDIPLALDLAYLIRGVATLARCSAHRAHEPGAIDDATRYLIAEVAA